MKRKKETQRERMAEREREKEAGYPKQKKELVKQKQDVQLRKKVTVF